MNTGGYQLSEGALQTIMSGGDCHEPIMQILGNKKIAGNAASERYRILISDGVHLNSFAMLATQLNSQITDGTLADFSIIRMNRHIVSTINNSGKADKRVLVILDLTVLVNGAEVKEKIGNPVPLQEGPGSANGTTSAPAVNGHSSTAPAPSNQATAPRSIGGNRSVARPDLNQSIGGTSATTKIVSLSPYQNRWTIKARVSNKAGIRTWSNARGNGKLFSVDLIDDTGEIRATAFNAECDKFYDMLEMNKVYLISKCALKPANKKFSSLSHDFEMSFTRETVIVPCEEEDESIPAISYNFIPLNKIPEKEPNTIVDAIGICVSASDVQNLVARTTQRELQKRDVSIVDQTGTRVDITLWGTQAVEFDPTDEPIVAVKGGRVTEYSGSRSIGLLGSSSLVLNPDIPEAHQLRGWYDTQEARSMDFRNVSARTGAGGADNGSSDIISLRDFRDKQLGSGDKPDYFSIKGTVTHVRQENALYQACPLGDCKRKVVDQNNGFFRCEKCCKEVPNYIWRLLLNVHVVDWSGEVWITLFQETAEQLLGMTAAEVGAVKEEHNDISSCFKNIRFSEHIFRLRAKQETYNDETRVRVAAVTAKAPDRKSYCDYLIKEIKQLAGIGVVVA
nr:PREDICTED: replication protein A 70 kDa DNA-binding subunit [Bemisia tabaci]